jgi:hypothetical protein
MFGRRRRWRPRTAEDRLSGDGGDPKMLGCIVLAVVLIMAFLTLTVVLAECNSGSSAGPLEGRFKQLEHVREI